MSDEQGFLNRILADLKDDLGRLVYADWLEERGDEESLAKSEFLRLQGLWSKVPEEKREKSPLHKKLRELAGAIDTRWLAVVSKVAVENCEISFQFECPKKWENLRATADQAVRACDHCARNVYFCESVVDARTLARRGECVAIDPSAMRAAGDLEFREFVTMGVLAVPSEREDRSDGEESTPKHDGIGTRLRRLLRRNK